MSDSDVLSRQGLASIFSGIACVSILLLLVVFAKGPVVPAVIVMVALLLFCPILIAEMEVRQSSDTELMPEPS